MLLRLIKTTMYEICFDRLKTEKTLYNSVLLGFDFDFFTF